MRLKRIKDPSLVEDYEHVFSGDDAIDHDVEDWQKRWEEAMESGDLTQLPLKKGRTPVIWKLRHLRGIPRARVRDMLFNAFRDGVTRLPEAITYHACRFALAGVRGLVDETNRPVSDVPSFPETEDWGRASSVTEDFMAELAMIEVDGSITHDTLVQELGATAIGRMTLSGNS